ncbi:MAG: Phosphate acyltransferase [bacterium ADurb.Bin243]|nr:MAG: Phosphate acyltransferase [bacterium ADurb.Bin243]
MILIDAGATADCKPINLHQFAIMGAIYSERIFGRKNPRIGLLSNGTEDRKGNKLTLETFPLLKNSKLNFIGNVEGSSVFKNVCDVIVCDGFSGNIMLKSIESSCEMIMSTAKKIIGDMMAGAAKSTAGDANSAGILKVIGDMQKRLDYAEYGGAPLLGVLGTCIISHGSSKAKAIKNAIGVARKFVAEKINETIEQDISKLF